MNRDYKGIKQWFLKQSKEQKEELLYKMQRKVDSYIEMAPERELIKKIT